MTVTMKNIVFWNVTLCSAQTFTDILKQSRLISPDYVASHLTIQYSSYFSLISS